MFMAEEGKLDLVEKELDRRFGGRVYRARSYSTFLEVMAAGVSKGHALKLALKLRGIDPAATLAIGDGENDLPMLAAVGFSAAPANAAEDVRRAAQVVIGSSADEGPARFLEDLLK
jgi:hydroxymethylpyrimidine pyrophosphatase-like HAD family hydrolase